MRWVSFHSVQFWHRFVCRVHLQLLAAIAVSTPPTLNPFSLLFAPLCLFVLLSTSASCLPFPYVCHLYLNLLKHFSEITFSLNCQSGLHCCRYPLSLYCRLSLTLSPLALLLFFWFYPFKLLLLIWFDFARVKDAHSISLSNQETVSFDRINHLDI